jgi:uncharacterized repeat protein (TIGR03803 family)
MNLANLNLSRMAAFVAAVVVLTLGVSAIPAQAQTYTDLFNFPGDPGAAHPSGTLAQGRDGNLYGVSYEGGVNGSGQADGTIFKMTPAGVNTVIYSLTSTDDYCYIGLTLGSDGNFYGVCQGLGSNDGLVYKITPAGTFTLLHNFSGADGSDPSGVPIQFTDGNFYGTAHSGGAHGYGTVFKMTPTGTLTTLYSFDDSNDEGVASPCAALIVGKDGNFYGTFCRSPGGVFKMTPAGKLTVLYAFAGAPDGDTPAGVTQGTDGNFYGITVNGGANSTGTVYKLTPSGKETVLYSFSTASGTNYPGSPLVQGGDGNFYGGTTGCDYFGCLGNGTIFKITPSGTFTLVHTLDGTDGAVPENMIVDTNGIIYGWDFNGGLSGDGVFYSLNIGAKPFASLESTSGKEGAKVGILGQGFSSSSVVKFGGTKATTIVLTGTTFITATVPAAALTGSVTVTTGTTNLTSTQTFKVLPTITSFTPSSGPVGTSVTITGTGLDQTTKVTFDGKSATFTIIKDTEVTADVPTGAATGKIVVITKGGSATSVTSFTVN